MTSGDEDVDLREIADWSWGAIKKKICSSEIWPFLPVSKENTWTGSLKTLLLLRLMFFTLVIDQEWLQGG